MNNAQGKSNLEYSKRILRKVFKDIYGKSNQAIIYTMAISFARAYPLFKVEIMDFYTQLVKNKTISPRNNSKAKYKRIQTDDRIFRTDFSGDKPCLNCDDQIDLHKTVANNASASKASVKTIESFKIEMGEGRLSETEIKINVEAFAEKNGIEITSYNSLSDLVRIVYSSYEALD